jgi:hypothetical protein
VEKIELKFTHSNSSPTSWRLGTVALWARRSWRLDGRISSRRITGWSSRWVGGWICRRIPTWLWCARCYSGMGAAGASKRHCSRQRESCRPMTACRTGACWGIYACPTIRRIERVLSSSKEGACACIIMQVL